MDQDEYQEQEQDLAVAHKMLYEAATYATDLLAQLKKIHPELLSLIEKQPKDEQPVLNRKLFAVEVVHIRLMKRRWARHDAENTESVLVAYEGILREVPFACTVSENAIKLVERLRTNWLEANTMALKAATENLKDCYNKQYPESKLE